MRVLHVTQCLAGGVPDAIETIARVSLDHEHSVMWPSGNDGDKVDAFRRIYHTPTSHFTFVSRLRLVVREERPDIVHAHSSWAGLYARIANLKTPIVYQPHCYAFDDPSRSAPGRAAIRGVEAMLARRTSVTVALTAHEERLAIGLAPGSRVDQIPNISRVEPKISWTPAPDSRTIVMVGRVAPQKDPEFFARIAESVRAAYPEVEFTWVGSGDARLTERLEDAGVHVTGWVPQQEVHRMLSTAFLYLHTASYEGFPLTVLDAAAIGSPILVRSIPSFEGMGLEMVRDVEEASNYVMRLLSNGGTDELRSANAYLNARSTKEAMISALSRVYRGALKRPS